MRDWHTLTQPSFPGFPRELRDSLPRRLEAVVNNPGRLWRITNP